LYNIKPVFLADDPVPAKFLSYNRANRAVAVLCNHQRASIAGSITYHD
jgi:hypothetical protein